jgi:hypothetical protein
MSPHSPLSPAPSGAFFRFQSSPIEVDSYSPGGRIYMLETTTLLVVASPQPARETTSSRRFFFLRRPRQSRAAGATLRNTLRSGTPMCCETSTNFSIPQM